LQKFYRGEIGYRLGGERGTEGVLLNRGAGLRDTRSCCVKLKTREKKKERVIKKGKKKMRFPTQK